MIIKGGNVVYNLCKGCMKPFHSINHSNLIILLAQVFLSIMYAVSSLGHAASIADSIFSAKSTAGSIFDIIDKVCCHVQWNLSVTFFKIILQKSYIDSSLVVEEHFETRGHISLENVSFCYPNREKHAVSTFLQSNCMRIRVYVYVYAVNQFQDR